MTTTPSSAETPPPNEVRGKFERRAVVSGTLGSAIEYFDFAIYGALSATLFPTLFFSELGSTGGLVASFATFGVGFFARPLGALAFGHYGDRYGRLPALYVSITLMGLCSAIIGLLPTGQGAGIAALLVGLRFIQGFSLGGETSGNQLMVMEHGRQNRRGLLASFVVLGSPLSQVLANMTLLLLTSVLTTAQWESWGWRIPFIASLAIVAVALYMRLKLEETPAFVAQQAKKRRADNGDAEVRRGGLQVLRKYPLEIVRLAIILGGPAASFYLVAVFGLHMLTDNYGFSSNSTFAIIMLANCISIPACLFGGWISDRSGRKRPFLVGLVTNLLGVLLFFVFAPGSNLVFVTAAAALALCSVQYLSAIYPALMAEQFPTDMRYSGSALSFAFCNLFFSAPAPIVAALLDANFGPTSVMITALALIGLSLVVAFTVRERSHVDLVSFVGVADEAEQEAVEQRASVEQLDPK